MATPLQGLLQGCFLVLVCREGYSYAVILNEVKNLLADDTLSTAALVGSEEILRYAQDDIKKPRASTKVPTRGIFA